MMDSFLHETIQPYIDNENFLLEMRKFLGENAFKFIEYCESKNINRHEMLYLAHNGKAFELIK